MANYDISPIDPLKLEIQLRLAIEEDEKYKRENAAKFRAIEQSKTYEEFRNIVKASHLKPLDKRESMLPKEMRPAPWNSHACKKVRIPGSVEVTSEMTRHTEQKLDEILGSELGSHKFNQFWLLCSEDLEGRLKLLKRAFLDENIFKGCDLSVDLIVGIMDTLNEYLAQNLKISDETFYLVIKVLMSICSTPRFSLHKLFLSEKERIVIDQLKEKVKMYSEMKEKQGTSRDGDMSLAFLDNF